MTKRNRPVQSVGTLGAVALVLVLQACGGNNSSPMAGTGGTAGTTGGAGTSGVGTAGTMGSGGDTGTAGTTGTGGGAPGTPTCVGLLTVSSQMEPANHVACDPTLDINLCYRTCGPEKKGYKSETCTTAFSYQEMAGCTFPPGDYTCYKIPPTANAACPAGVTPQGSTACDVPECTVCNSTGGLDGGQYLDSTGAAKTGFCVCQAPNATTGARNWSCGSNNGSWPCPGQSGC